VTPQHPIRRGQNASAHFGPKQVTREIRESERMTIASARSTERQHHS
jgi:hypothetical protein